MASSYVLWNRDQYSQKISVVTNAVLDDVCPGLRSKGLEIMYNTPLVYGGLIYKNECVHYLLIDKEDPPTNTYNNPACSFYKGEDLILINNNTPCSKWTFSPFSNESLREYATTLRNIVEEKMVLIDKAASMNNYALQ